MLIIIYTIRLYYFSKHSFKFRIDLPWKGSISFSLSTVHTMLGTTLVFLILSYNIPKHKRHYMLRFFENCNIMLHYITKYLGNFYVVTFNFWLFHKYFSNLHGDLELSSFPCGRKNGF